MFVGCVIWAIVLDIVTWFRPLPGLGIIMAMQFFELALFRIDLLRVGIPCFAALVVYGLWMIAYSAFMAARKEGYNPSWVPESEQHSWTSAMGINGFGALCRCISLFPLLITTPALLEASAAVSSVEAHSKLKEMERAQYRLVRNRRKLLRAVLQHVPRYASQCLQSGILAFENRSPVLIAIRLGSKKENIADVRRDAIAAAEAHERIDRVMKQFQATWESFLQPNRREYDATMKPYLLHGQMLLREQNSKGNADVTDLGSDMNS